MFVNYRFIFLTLLSGIILSTSAPSQGNSLDSLWRAYGNPQLRDSLRIDAIHAITIKLSRINPDSGLAVGKEYHDFCNADAKRELFLSGAYNATGSCYLNKGNLDSALAHFNKSLFYRRKFKEKKGEAAALNNIGIIYYQKGDYFRCLDYYHKSLTIKDSLGDQRGVASSYSNIGMIYELQGNNSKAISYYRNALRIRDSLADKRGLADSYLKIGSIYMNDKQYDSSEYFVRKAIQYAHAAGDLRSAITATLNLGNILEKTGQSDSALANFNMALSMNREIGNDEGVASAQEEIGTFFLARNDYNKAKIYCDSAYQLAKLMGHATQEWEACYCLAQAYDGLNQPAAALNYFKLALDLSDSLNSAEKTRVLNDKSLQYEFEMEKLADSLRNQQQAELKEAQHQQDLQRQSIYTIAGIAGFIVMLVIAFILYRGYKLKQTTNRELEKKNILIEEKQKAILDSITYAKRLQEAILPSLDSVNQRFPSNFVIYKPKDIVAGDFYWMEHINGVTFIAAADCTGHGVPGALVSVVCSNALNRSVLEFGITDPGKILDRTRELVLETFSKSEKNVYDGMDISLAAIKDGELKWAGANNPLWIVEDGKFKEIKPDKQSIGKEEDPKPFTTITISPSKSTRVFLFTDGYADQFGGPHGKKFKYKQLQELIVSSSSRTIHEQGKAIEKTFENWKGSLEQIDDICVIGIELNPA